MDRTAFRSRSITFSSFAAVRTLKRILANSQLGRDILRLLLRRGLGVTAVGILLGLAGSLYLTRVLEAFLFQINPFDPLTYGAIAFVFLICAIAASYIPLSRAMRIDPMTVLRQD